MNMDNVYKTPRSILAYNSAEVSTLGPPAYARDSNVTATVASYAGGATTRRRFTTDSADGVLDAATMAATGSARRDSTAALEYYDTYASLPSSWLQSSTTTDPCDDTTTATTTVGSTTARPASSSASSTQYLYNYIEAEGPDLSLHVANCYNQVDGDVNAHDKFNNIYGHASTATGNANIYGNASTATGNVAPFDSWNSELYNIGGAARSATESAAEGGGSGRHKSPKNVPTQQHGSHIASRGDLNSTAETSLGCSITHGDSVGNKKPDPLSLSNATHAPFPTAPDIVLWQNPRRRRVLALACVVAATCILGIALGVSLGGEFTVEPAQAVAASSSSSGAAGAGSCDTKSFWSSRDAGCVVGTMCMPGSYVSRNLTDVADRSCGRCGNGTFSNRSNSQCANLTVCAAGYFEVLDGTLSSDRVCRLCAAGYFSAIPNQNRCTKVAAECGAGLEEAAGPTVSSDRVCWSCVAGKTYSRGTDGGCAAVRAPCGAGLEEAASPTVSSDRVCRPCVAGKTYSRGTVGGCVAVRAPCGAGSVEAAGPTVSSDRVCRLCERGTTGRRGTCVPATCKTLHEDGVRSNGKYLTLMGLDGARGKELRNMYCILSLQKDILPGIPAGRAMSLSWELWTQFGTSGSLPSMGNRIHHRVLDDSGPNFSRSIGILNSLLQPYNAMLQAGKVNSGRLYQPYRSRPRYCDEAVYSRAISFHSGNSKVGKYRFVVPLRFRHLLIKYGKCYVTNNQPVTLYQNGKAVRRLTTRTTRLDYVPCKPGDIFELREDGTLVASLYYILFAE